MSLSLSLGGGEGSEPGSGKKKDKRPSMRLRLVGPGWSGTGLTWGAGGCARPPRTISAAVVPLPHLGATGAGVPGPRPARACGRRRRLRGRLVGRRCLGRGPGGRGAFLGAGMPLPAPAPAALPPVVTMNGEGKACASVSVAVDVSRETAGSGRGDRDRVGRKKRILIFFAARRDAAPERGVGRGASSDLSHAPRRSSRLPSLGLSRRPAGLAPWGAGLGAWGRGDGTGKVSRAVSGWRPGESRWRPSGDDRSRAARSPPLGNARDGRCGRTHVLLLRPLLGHLLELFHCGVGRAGWGEVSAGARVGRRAGGGHRRRSPPFGFPWSAKQITAVESAPAIGGLAMFRARDSLSIRAFVAASMSPPYFLSMATTSSSPWPVIEIGV